MKISARNTLKGTVKKVEHGAVNSEVTLELPGGTEVVSIGQCFPLFRRKI